MQTVQILENDAGMRLDKFLTKAYPNLPQSMLYKAIRKKILNATESAAKFQPAYRPETS